LPDVHELGDGVLVVSPVLGVVLEDEVLEGLAEVDLLRFFEAKRDHWNFWSSVERKNIYDFLI